MNINLDNYDAIIEIVPTINEKAYSGNLDPRTSSGSLKQATDWIDVLRQSGASSNRSFGIALRNSLQLGPAYDVEVIDYNDACSVKVTYTSTKTGLQASKNFIILFKTSGPQCIVKSSSARWRTCNDYMQASSYIRSKASILSGKTNSID